MKRTTMRFFITLTIALALLCGHGLVAQTRSPEAQLKAAQQKEQVEGDIKAAIEQYKQLIARRDISRAVAAEALLGLAQSYEKLGVADARKVYEQIVRDYTDQTGVVAAARERFSALSGSASRGYAARQLLQLPNAIAVLTLFPDGRIGGTDWATGDLVAASPTSAEVSRLVKGDINGTPGPYAMFPVPSPDGRQLAYQWFDDGQQRQPGTLRVLSMERGAKPRTLVADAARVKNIEPISWSRDAASILVCYEKTGAADTAAPSGVRDFELAWVSADRGAITPLKSFEWWRSGVGAPHSIGKVSLSPDGGWIAYAVPDRQGSGDRSIFVMRANGTSVRRIVTGGVNDQPVWTPDGARLIFVSNRAGESALWSIAVSERGDGAPTIIKNGMAPVTLHGMLPSGVLVYEEMGLDPLIIAEFAQPLAANAKPAMRTLETLHGEAPAWSPDGRYLAFKRRTTDPGYPFDMIVRTVDSGELRTYSPRPARMGNGRPTWYTDGTVQAMRRSGIRLKVGGAGLEEVSVPASLPMGLVSPDGRTLYSVDSADGGIDVFDVPSGATTRRIAVLPGWRPARLSPDGRMLALIRASEDGSAAVGVIGVDGDGFRRVAGSFPGASTYSVVWARDGRALFVRVDTATDMASIQRVPLDGGAPLTIAANLGEVRSFDISPDERRIAYSLNVPTTDVWMLDLKGALK